MTFVRVLLGAGVLLAGGGTWLLLTDRARQDVKRVEVLPRSDPAGLASMAPGAAVLVEGRLTSREPPGPRGFVAYHHDRFSRHETSGPDEGKEVWYRLGTVRPAIAIEAGGVTVAVENRDYILDDWPHMERTEEVPRVASLVEATERYLGFKSGDLVTVDGRVATGAGELRAAPRLQATVLYGGDRTAYLASLRGDILVLKVVGGIFLGFGALMLLVGVKWLRASGKPLRGHGR